MEGLLEEGLSMFGSFSVLAEVLGVVGGCAARGVNCVIRGIAAKVSAKASAEGTRRLRNGILATLRRVRESQGWV